MWGGDFGKVGDALSELLVWGAIWIVVSTPLAAWKFYDIAVWLQQHVRLEFTQEKVK